MIGFMSSYTLILRRYEEEYGGDKYYYLSTSESLGDMRSMALEVSG